MKDTIAKENRSPNLGVILRNMAATAKNLDSKLKMIRFHSHLIAGKYVYAPQTAEEQTSHIAFVVAQWEAGVRPDVTRVQYFSTLRNGGGYIKAVTRDDPERPDWYKYSYQDGKWMDYPWHQAVADQWAPLVDGGYFAEVTEEECLNDIGETQARYEERQRAASKAPDKQTLRKPSDPA
jgi:hypothetical protein